MSKKLLFINECSLQAYQNESVILFSLSSFPFDQHKQWLEAFCDCIKISNGELESSAELTLCSLSFENTVFILHINELVESIWISSTLNGDLAQSQLIRLFQHIQQRLKS